MKRLALALILGLWASAADAQALLPIGTQLTKFFNTTQSISRAFPAISGKSIYITQFAISGASTSVVTLTTGTGTNCGTGAAIIYTVTFAAGETISIGDGAGVAAVVGSGLDLCVTIATASASGWLSVAQF